MADVALVQTAKAALRDMLEESVIRGMERAREYPLQTFFGGEVARFLDTQHRQPGPVEPPKPIVRTLGASASSLRNKKGGGLFMTREELRRPKPRQLVQLFGHLGSLVESGTALTAMAREILARHPSLAKDAPEAEVELEEREAEQDGPEDDGEENKGDDDEQDEPGGDEPEMDGGAAGQGNELPEVEPPAETESTGSPSFRRRNEDVPPPATPPIQAPASAIDVIGGVMKDQARRSARQCLALGAEPTRVLQSPPKKAAKVQVA